MAVVPVPPGTAAGEVVVRNGPEIRGRAPVQNGVARVRIPDQPGLYDLTYDAGTEVRKAFAVNPPPKESALIYLSDPEALRAWRPVAAEASPRVLARTEVARLSGALQQRWWWWMLCAALAALALETVLAAARRKAA
jgi:hypothetical protein